MWCPPPCPLEKSPFVLAEDGLASDRCFRSAQPSDGGGAGMVTVGLVGGGPGRVGPGSGLSQVTQSRSPTPTTRRNILIKVRSASGYFRLLGGSDGSPPFRCGSMLRD